MVTYKDPSGTDKIITAKKVANDKWAFDPANVPDGVKIKEDTGAISIPADKIQNNTQVSATAKDVDNTSDGSTVTSKDNKAPAAPEISEDAEGNVTVTLPKDKDATKLTFKYTDANGTVQTVEVIKTGNDWALPQNAPQGITIADGKITIPDANTKNGTRVSAQAEDANGNKTSERGITIKSDADRIDPIIPAKTPVADPTNLKADEQKAVKEAIEKANENKFPQGTKVEVGTDGTATITYPDGSTDTISAASLVEKVDKTELKAEVNKNNNDAIKNSDKYKNADQTKKDAYDTALDKAKTVLNDPNAKQKDVNDALQQLKEAESALDGQADKTKPTAPIVTAEDNGSVKVTPPTDAKATKVEVTYTPEGQTDTVTVKAIKEDGTWKLADGTDNAITIDSNGVITIPANKVKDNTEVKAVAKDANDNTSEETNDSKATAKAPSTTPDTTAPGAPTVKANDDGSVTVTPPTDTDLKSVTIKYTDPQGSEKTVTATKDGNTWTFNPVDAGFTIDARGDIVIPKDQVKPGTEVSATAKDANDNTSEETENSKATAKYVIKDPTTHVTVDNAKALTKENKEAVKNAVKQANTDLQNDVRIEVADDGAVTIKDNTGNIIGTIPAEKTVKQDESKLGVKAPEAVEVADTDNVSEAEQGKIKEAVKAANQDLNLSDTDITVDNQGNVTVTKGGKTGTLKPEQTVKKAGEKLADKYTPSYTEADGQAGTQTTVSAPNFKDSQNQDVAVPANTTFTLGNGAPTGASIDANGKITYTPSDADAGKDIKIPVVVKYSDGSTDNIEAKITVAGQNINKPNAPTVTANNDGSVTVTPSNDANTKTLEVTYTPTGQTNPVTLTAKKGNDGKWSLPDGALEVSIDPNTGIITIPADKVADGTQVKAIAKDSTGNHSSDETSANAQTPSTRPDTTAPQAPKVEAKDNGDVTVTPPTDADTKEVEVTYTPEGKTDPVKVTATKDPQTGKWSVPEGSDVKVDPDTGVITVPADKVKDGTEVSAVAKDEAGNASTPTDTSKAKAKTPGETKPGDNTPGSGNKKALLPTDDYQDTGIKAGDDVDTNSISAIDEDGSYVPVYVDNNGNIIVKPGKDVDGPIKVTIKTKDGEERFIFIDILGHKMGADDNGYRPGYFDGSSIIPGIRYRDHKTPTHPVTVTVPEKTETGVKVHDTLWYVFRINDFQYEVVRNGVVTKRLMDVTPVLQNGRTMLPLRYVAEALQADVKWDGKTRTATFTKDGLTASIQIDSDEIVLSNGKTVKMDSKPLNINDRILVSVTNVANVFGLTNGNTKDKADQDIEWEQKDKSATIYIRR